MRIIAGTLKGRRIEGPPGAGVRPTSDGLRETLFNILGDTIEGARVLDAFAGTGAVGLEALSRGAAHATFVERDARMAAVLAGNVERCGVANACAIIRGDFASTPAAGIYDLVWLDPPYDAADLEGAVRRAGALAAPGGRVILEHSRRRDVPDEVGGWRRVRRVVAGDSALSFFARAAAADAAR